MSFIRSKSFKPEGLFDENVTLIPELGEMP
jgi:hypothetical protein